MAPRSRRRPLGRTGRTAPWLIAALTLFIVGDGILIWAAMTAAQTEPAPAVDSRISISPSISPTAGPEPATEADFTVTRPTVLLAAVNPDLAYRALSGECPATPANLEFTTDGGSTWSPAMVTGAAAIASIVPESSTDVSVLARAASDCSPTVYRSFVQGAGWVPADEVDARWRVDGVQIVAPGGLPSIPCADPVQVAAQSASEAAALCSDAVVATTSDGGASWRNSDPVSGAAALAASPDGYVVALERQGGCEGVSVATLDAALSAGVPGACVAGAFEDGTVAVASSIDGSTLWLRAGETFARSFDGGRTW